MRDFLEKQSSSIESVLSAHGFKVSIPSGALSPRLIHYQLSLPSGVRLAQLAPLLGELADTLGVSAVRLSSDSEGGAPTLEVPRPDPAPVRLLPLAKKVAEQVPTNSATLGLDRAGNPLLLRLESREVGSVLLAGDNGAGKSSLLQVMALSLALHNAPNDLKLLAFDLSGSARRTRSRAGTWNSLEELPHLIAAPIHDQQETTLRMRWLGRVLRDRHTALAEDGTLDGPGLVILIDGIDAALQGPDAAERRQLLAALTERGRELRLYLVGATRSPNLLTGINWGARIVGRSIDPEGARVASGMPGSGAEGLLGGGDFLVVLGAEAVRFQAAQASEDDLTRTANLLHKVAAAERRAREVDQSLPDSSAKSRRTAKPTSRQGWASTGSLGRSGSGQD